MEGTDLSEIQWHQRLTLFFPNPGGLDAMLKNVFLSVSPVLWPLAKGREFHCPSLAGVSLQPPSAHPKGLGSRGRGWTALGYLGLSSPHLQLLTGRSPP